MSEHCSHPVEKIGAKRVEGLDSPYCEECGFEGTAINDPSIAPITLHVDAWEKWSLSHVVDCAHEDEKINVVWGPRGYQAFCSCGHKGTIQWSEAMARYSLLAEAWKKLHG